MLESEQCANLNTWFHKTCAFFNEFSLAGRHDPTNQGRFITTGLWSWSQHPNYFGEILLWAGIAVIALPTLHGPQLATLISPIFVYVLLTRISGIPLLRARAKKQWGDEAEYQAYRARTAVLVPRPPRS